MIPKPSAPQKPGKPPAAKKKGFLRRFVLAPFLVLMILGLIVLAAAVGGYQYLSQDLPKINSLRDYRPPIITTVYAEDGQKIAEFFKERRIVIPLAEVPPVLVNAFFTPGNHDHYPNRELYNYHLFIDRTHINDNDRYVITYENLSLCSMNSDPNSYAKPSDRVNSLSIGLTNEDMVWLNEKLNNSITNKKIILMHHPSINIRNNQGELYDVFIHNIQKFIALCESYNVDVVLAGHTHDPRVFDANEHLYENLPINSRNYTALFVQSEDCKEALHYRNISIVGNDIWIEQNKELEFTCFGFEYPERVDAGAISAGFFRTLGVTPVAGRKFVDEESDPGGDNQVVLLGHRIWRTRCGTDHATVGRAITLDGEPYAVVGVLPPGTPWLDAADLFVPMVYRADLDRGSFELAVIGRLKQGVKMEAARADLEAVCRQLAEAYPDTDQGMGVDLLSFDDWVTDDSLRGVRSGC